MLLHAEPLITAAVLERLCLPRPLPASRLEAFVGHGDGEPRDDPAWIQQVLMQTGGNVVQAAHLLGMSRGALRYHMRRYGIVRPLLPLSSSIPAFPSQGGRGAEMHHGGEREEKQRSGNRNPWRCWRSTWPGRRQRVSTPRALHSGRCPADGSRSLWRRCRDSGDASYSTRLARAIAAHRGLWHSADPGAAAAPRCTSGHGDPAPDGGGPGAG